MPPTSIHLNGSINLVDTDEVFKTLGSALGALAHAYPDGETDSRFTGQDPVPGNRRYWIWFQTPVLEAALGRPDIAELFGDPFPRFGLHGRDPEDVTWGNLGYADAYIQSYLRFQELKTIGAIPSSVRFQVEYPTPLAVISSFCEPTDIGLILPGYTRALLRDLERLTLTIPREELSVQWDVASEVVGLQGAFGPVPTYEEVASQLGRLIDAIPIGAEAGIHLCYGDYRHQHFQDPESLELQVKLIAATVAAARRKIDFFAITVPQHESRPEFFEPLRDLRVQGGTTLYFALVPYHPEDQEPGTTDKQIELIDACLTKDPLNGGPEWGVCTECGLGRAEQEDVPYLIQLHKTIVDGASVPA